MVHHYPPIAAALSISLTSFDISLSPLPLISAVSPFPVALQPPFEGAVFVPCLPAAAEPILHKLPSIALQTASSFTRKLSMMLSVHPLAQDECFSLLLFQRKLTRLLNLVEGKDYSFSLTINPQVIIRGFPSLRLSFSQRTVS